MTDDIVGKQASELYADARVMLKKIVKEKWLTAKAACGFWPANTVGDDIVLQKEGADVWLRCLRQQADKPIERPNLCLADFIAPKDSGKQDWVGAFAVTTGLGIEPHLERFRACLLYTSRCV